MLPNNCGRSVEENISFINSTTKDQRSTGFQMNGTCWVNKEVRRN